MLHNCPLLEVHGTGVRGVTLSGMGWPSRGPCAPPGFCVPTWGVCPCRAVRAHFGLCMLIGSRCTHLGLCVSIWGCACPFGAVHAHLGLCVSIWDCTCLYEARHIHTTLYVPTWGCVLVSFLQMGSGHARAGCVCTNAGLCTLVYALASLSVLLQRCAGCLPPGVAECARVGLCAPLCGVVHACGKGIRRWLRAVSHVPELEIMGKQAVEAKT